MKYIWCLLGCLLSLGIQAQDVQYSEEKGIWERQRFIDAYDYVFLTKEPTRQLFKLNIVDLLPVSFRINDRKSNQLFFAPRLGLGFIFERKIGQAWSINGSVSPLVSTTFNINSTVSAQSIRSTVFTLGLEIEPRWYYDMRKRIISGKSANNLSGNYIGLGLLSRWDARSYSFSSNTEVIQEYNILLKYGLQRRIFGKGYIDVNFGIGARNAFFYSTFDPDVGFAYQRSWDLLYGAELGFGIAFGGAPDKEIDSRLCDAFRCHLEENSMLRIVLNRILQGNSSSGFGGSLIIEYERKLGNPFWSINGEIGINYQNFRYWTYVDQATIQNSSFQVGQRFALGLRYYYNLKQKIASGQSANNLSANYLTLISSYEFSPQVFFANINNTIVARDDYAHNFELIPAWGFQRRIFKHGFLDYKIGLGIGSGRSLEFNISNGEFERSRLFKFDEFYWLFLSEIRFGLAF
ncbi:MAG: hypothetical protein AAFP19_08505 [Bacteroidota bacterium]